MPLVHIDMLEGRPTEYKLAVLGAVREALVSTVDVGHERIIQRLHELPAECMDIPPGKTEQAVVLEVTMLEGRPPEKKAAFHDEVRRRLAQDPGIAPTDVYVIVRDVPKHDLCAGAPLESQS